MTEAGGISFTVHDWMAGQLGLKGTRLLAYAVVYHYTQTEGAYRAGLKPLAELLGMSCNYISTLLGEMMAEGLITSAKNGRTVEYISSARRSIGPENTPNSSARRSIEPEKSSNSSARRSIGPENTPNSSARRSIEPEPTKKIPPYNPLKETYTPTYTKVYVPPKGVARTNFSDPELPFILTAPTDTPPQAEKEAPTPVAPAPKTFRRPSLEEVAAYCRERQNDVDPQRFMDHYTSNGWKVGKNPMRDWKAAVRTWEQRREYDKPSQYRQPPPPRQRLGTADPRDIDVSQFYND